MYVNTLCSKYFVSLNVYEVLVFLSYLENFLPLTYFFPTTCRKYYSQSKNNSFKNLASVQVGPFNLWETQ